MAEKSDQVRVMLWAPPKSLSTVFQKMMSFVDDCQIVNEPYQSAGSNNPEMIQKMSDSGLKEFVDSFSTASEQDLGNLRDVGWDDAQCTPAWCKNLLEGPFPGKKVVFAKDLIFGIRDQFHLIPKGYRHTFIIRNPTKVMISFRKSIIKMVPQQPGQEFSILTMPRFLRELYSPILQLIEYVKKNEGETNPIIIDADDLQNHPESIVRQYCEAVGIPFKKSLLEWPAGDDCVKNNWLVSRMMLQGNALVGYYEAAFASTKFNPVKPLPPANEITPDVIEAARDEETFYKELYDMRLKP